MGEIPAGAIKLSTQFWKAGRKYNDTCFRVYVLKYDLQRKFGLYAALSIAWSAIQPFLEGLNGVVAFTVIG